MSFGMEVYGDGGESWFQMTDRLIRVVDWFQVTTVSGSRTVWGLGANGFFIVQSEGGTGTGGYKWGSSRPVLQGYNFWRSGDTLHWSFDYAHNYHSVNERNGGARAYVLAVLFR